MLVSWIESHIALILIAALFAGLFWPLPFDAVPVWVIPALIAVNFFFSSAKLNLHDIDRALLGRLLPFLALRFLVLPPVVFAILFVCFGPALALAGLLLALAPVGVTAPPVAIINRGNVPMTMAALAATSLVTPFLIPLMTEMLAGQHMPVEPLTLLLAIFLLILGPFVLYHLLRPRMPFLKPFLIQHVSWVSIVMIALTVLIIVGQQRAAFFSAFDNIVVLAVSVALYAGFYAAGWWWPPFTARLEDRIAGSALSGVNNIALVIGISALYMPAPVPLYVVLADIVWCLAVPVYQAVLAHMRRRAGQ